MIKKLVKLEEYNRMKVQIINQIESILSSYEESIDGADLVYKFKNQLIMNFQECDKYHIVQYLHSLHFNIEELLNESVLEDYVVQLVGEDILSISNTLKQKWYTILTKDDLINILKELNT